MTAAAEDLNVKVRRAHTHGRERGDQVCRVPGADRDSSLVLLKSQLMIAEDWRESAVRELAYAEGQVERLRERVLNQDVEPLPPSDPVIGSYGLANAHGNVPMPDPHFPEWQGWIYDDDWPQSGGITAPDGKRFVLAGPPLHWQEARRG